MCVASLLFTAPSKVSASCALTTKPSAVSPSQGLLPSHLRTPSPGVHKYASFSLSPGPEEALESEELEEIEEEFGDREVEHAGKSSRDYGQWYVSLV